MILEVMLNVQIYSVIPQNRKFYLQELFKKSERSESDENLSVFCSEGTQLSLQNLSFCSKFLNSNLYVQMFRNLLSCADPRKMRKWGIPEAFLNNSKLNSFGTFSLYSTYVQNVLLFCEVFLIQNWKAASFE